MSSNPKVTYLKDYRPFSHEVLSVDLTFELFEDKVWVQNRMLLKAKAAESSLRLDGADLKLLEIRLDGQPFNEANTQKAAESLTLFGLPDRFELLLRTEIYPKENRSLEGLYQSGKLFCTQCEAQGFRKITYFPDRPDVMTLFRTKIIADKALYPVLLSNGNEVERGGLEGGRHFVTWLDPFKKPCYLFALVAGKMVVLRDHFLTQSGRTLTLELWTEPENAHKTHHGMESLKKAMAWDERVYDLEYDLDIFMIVAVKDFNMGAMENKGLNLFNASCALADPRTATDAEFEYVLGVIGHEYFHNWTGNRVTCRDWFQLSLKEGLTIFRDQAFSANMTSPAVKRIEEVKLLKTHQFAEDSGPMAHPVRPESFIEINNFYTLTVYHKGSELIRMMSLVLGEEGYFRGIREYFKRHDGQAATVEDFVAALEAGSGKSLEPFKAWYGQAGTPRLKAVSRFEGSTLELELSQETPPTHGQSEKHPLPIPVLLKGFGAKGEVLVPETLVVLDQKQQLYRFEGMTERPILSLLRGFSAPVKLDFSPPNSDRLFLMAQDDDPYNAFEAAQGLLGEKLLELTGRWKENLPLAGETGLESAIGALLRSPKDPALVALAVALPSETYLLEQMETMAVEAVYAARRFLKHSLGLGLEQDWLKLYHKLNDHAPYRFEAVAVGRRALKNLCLDFLSATDKPEHLELCLAQLAQADNMTDRLAVLGILCHRFGDEKRSALKEFYQEFHEDDLVLTKFFSLQAASPEFGVKEVGGLLEHLSFDRKNPNHLRAVIASFAQRNLLQFHKPDGSGYRFLADQVLNLNHQNPQIAARLLLPLGRFQRFGLPQKDLAKAEMVRILESPGLAPDVYEIAAKSLDKE
ncbi:MAG: aminopeptidase N [Candidatus Lambdaproteobacteria bacterium RIFOXYD1_FULL_56_27]|uniref:Aminopeptidase N n=1 Tax=Candidatus Lambdaproteobacteria bacterium RIFOXYD2_FULL_56_26 TaxID=1817773 RepID=A0A1F6GTC4_9PROT|nr:MAG: aminopeptidase N [Candidatus Lambdaproteobacteria bacterium RIFOXYC1_FULL_56_13]OGH01422.1 MAG: aminopeptidase N [Candidatus Lambdaproteobacteria bacterium RIFOXYD2_FULL_56_26]OGH06518.1 MAG: aminopeptidase N [Candidatus Lambdaproteobacteria bacterium RIFOXYD1_FULL_56_27]